MLTSTSKKNYAEALAEGRLKILFIGKKGHDYFKRRLKNVEFITDYKDLYNKANYDELAKASQYIIDAFTSDEVDQVEIYYGRFKNAATQFPEREQFLPVQKIDTDPSEKSKHIPDYIFEPDQAELLSRNGAVDIGDDLF